VSKAALKIVDPASKAGILTLVSSHGDLLSPEKLQELTVKRIVVRITALQTLISAEAPPAEIERGAVREPA
jgi:hypothetical protein